MYAKAVKICEVLINLLLCLTRPGMYVQEKTQCTLGSYYMWSWASMGSIWQCTPHRLSGTTEPHTVSPHSQEKSTTGKPTETESRLVVIYNSRLWRRMFMGKGVATFKTTSFI